MMSKIKNVMIFIVASALNVACAEKKEESAAAGEESKPVVTLPYDVSQDKFEMGNAELSKMILQGSWKDWEENNLNTSWLSDTLDAWQSDNTNVKGADSLIARWKRGRAALTSAKAHIDAVVPLHNTVNGDDWVLVWASEIDTKKDGTVDTVYLMETWHINKAGKADALYQFDRNQRKK